MTDWANRITAYDPNVDPEQLLAHPENPRRHPAVQRDALRESLDGVGWVDVVKVNTVTGHVVDGHARVEEAITAGVAVPVLYVELSADEERYVLATLDPIAALATYEFDVMADLLDAVNVETEALSDWLSNRAGRSLFDPPDLFGPDGSGDGGLDGGHGEDGPDAWPMLVLRVPPAVHDAWLERCGDQAPYVVLADLLA